MSKLTLHPSQFLYHYDGDVLFAETNIVWDSNCAQVVQLHQTYKDKCTANRLAHIVDRFDLLKEELREQGVTEVITYSKSYDRKMGRYWKLLGFEYSGLYEGITYSRMEI